MNAQNRLWKWLFLLAALEAGAAFVALLAVPHEGGRFSASRLALLLVLGLCAVLGAFLAAKPPAWLARIQRPALAWVPGLLGLLLAATLFLLRYAFPELLLPYYERIGPLLWYLSILSAEVALWILWSSRGLQVEAWRSDVRLWRAVGIALLSMLAVYLFVLVTRLGITPDSAYWAEPGVPVLGWQMAVVVLCGALAFLASLGPSLRVPSRIIIPVVIWVIAVAAWLSVPEAVMKNSFYAPIDPPTNQSLPNSDAGYYDSMAHSLLLGYPYQGDIPTRPLYITFLTVLHLAAGEDYSLIVAGQTMLLALIPVALYLLGARLHSRAAGIMTALFAIFREVNSLLIASQTRVSNTKTLLVDLPTLLLLLVACLFAVRWLQRQRSLDALLAGGLAGLLLLLRTQTLLVLPLVMVAAVFAYGIRNRALPYALGAFIVGLAAAMAPWLIHNFLHTGQLTLDAPFEYQVIASQYKYTGNLDLGAVSPEGKGVLGLLLTFAAKDPGFVAGFIISHFLATLIDSLLALPLAAPYAGLFAPLNLYWMIWPAHIDPPNAVLLLPYMALAALGIAAGWKRLRWASLVPLLFAVGYAAANGVGRFSGWRYDLPADWVAYFYILLGIAELFRLLWVLFGGTVPDRVVLADPIPLPRREAWKRGIAAAVLLALAGALPWFAEGLAPPPRYAADTLPVLVARLDGAPSVRALGVDGQQVQAFLAQPGSGLQIGQVLYPRYFTRNNGLMSSHPWPAYQVRDFPRVGFRLLDRSLHDAVMPMRGPEDGFQQGSDAIVLGCLRADYIDVRLIYFPASGQAYLAAPLSDSCN